jgi:hypothetical protein
MARVEADTRQSFTLRYSHHLEPAQGRTLALWMDRELKGGTVWAQTPQIALAMRTSEPEAVVKPDQPGDVEKVDIVYALGDQIPPARFWRSAQGSHEGDTWRASLPIMDIHQPLRALANVTYREGYTLSSPLATAVLTTLDLQVKATDTPSSRIDDFAEGVDDWTYGLAYTDPWQDHTYLRASRGPDGDAALTLNPDFWGDQEISYIIGTHKVDDPKWTAPPGAALAFWYRSAAPSTLEVHAWVDHWGPHMKEYTAHIPLNGADDWQQITVRASQCLAADGGSLTAWSAADRLDFAGKSPAHKPPLFARIEWK